MTYSQHKAAVDLAYPTPAIAWYLHADDPGHHFDDFSVAYAVVTNVEGHTQRYEAAVSGTTGVHQWRLLGVADLDGMRGPGGANFATWALMTTEVARQWEMRNEAGRVRIATELTARDFLADAGLVLEPAPVFTAATATLAGIIPNLETLTPAFHRDTLAYAYAADHALFLPAATLGFPGQSVFWQLGREVEEGIRPVLSLDSGENVITITVVSADRQNVKTYTLTVTRA